MQRTIIRRMQLAHCKLGPALCAQCREMAAERICLLEIYPPGAGQAQRRLIQVETDAGQEWVAFEVVTTFEGPEQARAYAQAHGISDVVL
jgi:hypothetical protein